MPFGTGGNSGHFSRGGGVECNFLQFSSRGMPLQAPSDIVLWQALLFAITCGMPPNFKYAIPRLVCIALMGILPGAIGAAALPAFPGAQGVGAMATGGARNAGKTTEIYHVTNLRDSGPGSFRDAVSKGYRIVVFDVAGYIDLKPGAAVSVTSNLTIAGESAPGQGIALDGAEVSFTKAHNVICRNIRFRQSSRDPNKGKSAVGMDNASDIIMDHVSVEFGKWDNIDCNNSQNITFQYCFDANPIGQQFNAHADSAVTWYRNLWSSAHNRNPLAKGNIDFINNALYNFQSGLTAHTGGDFTMDIVNNCFICGPSGKPGTPFFQIGGNIGIYGKGNCLDNKKDGTLNPKEIGVPGGHKLSAPWNPAITNSIPTLSAADAYVEVTSMAGALPWNRDPVDAQVAAEAISLGRQGRMWKSESETGLPNHGLGVIEAGQAPPDSNGDGMPDYWKAAVTRGASATTLDPLAVARSGYLNIEDYLHFMAIPHAVTVVNKAVLVNLGQYASGFRSPTFTVTGAFHGTASLGTDGHTVLFTPANSFVGVGGFQFSLPYPDGATATYTVGVCVSTVGVPQAAPAAKTGI
jgi:pectate lyase